MIYINGPSSIWHDLYFTNLYLSINQTWCSLRIYPGDDVGSSAVHRPTVSSGGVHFDASMLGLSEVVMWQGKSSILRVCGNRAAVC